ncbi:oligopeptide transporter, OPT family [Proteiniclasticum sp. QWL-01]|uniref:OPT family oligopeptide transporter n=1 Tax=Proteiniclasticum sp. QWL-01 TaxID=3036945 RepID=UPI0024112AD4|nr:oligopeptide transporter, OPT family [Proteiniclasticum sp. QWL-01]WFF73135.1 oligopeptide transporter, OPT family [Proteiniclasticum sp. QWL-01]
MDNKLSKEAYGGINGKDYVPYITSGDKKGGNLIVMIAGIILAVLFAASTAYSGMKSGLTVAAGIPGSILGSAIIAAFAKQKGILGKNLLQGMSAGGESVASGLIFVLPAVLLIGGKISFIEGIAVGAAGVLFGIGVSTLVHDYLLVEEHGKLMYPESMAISETLVASEGMGESIKYMGIGFGIGGLITLVTSSFLNKVNNVISYVNETFYKWRMEVEVSPMLLGIGYIVGMEVSLMMFAGSILANFAVLPLIGYFSSFAADGVTVWNNPGVAINAMKVGNIAGSYLRYIGAGMMLSGGLIGAIKLIPTIITSIKKTLGAKTSAAGSEEGAGVGRIILLAGFIISFIAGFLISGGNVMMALLASVLSVVLAMLFAIVSGRLTGTVGTSNLPVSGMTIASLVLVTLLFLGFGWTSPENNKSLLLFGSFIVTAIAMAGGYTQSQKVSMVLGGSRNEMSKYLAIASIVGVVTVVGTIMLLADQLVLTGDQMQFALPQANLMATLTEGIISGRLPWGMIITGIVMGIFFYLLKLPVMTVAIGFYLPIATTSIILIGALIRQFIEMTAKTTADKEAKISNGISLSAGLVAGSSIIGLIGIILQVTGVLKLPDITGFAASNNMAWILLAVLIGLTVVTLMNAGARKSGK